MDALLVAALGLAGSIWAGCRLGHGLSDQGRRPGRFWLAFGAVVAAYVTLLLAFPLWPDRLLGG